MKNHKLLLGSALFLLFTILQTKLSLSQEIKQCGTNEAIQALYRAHPEMVQEAIEYEKAIQKQIQDQKFSRSIDTTSIYYIPIVFHVIHTNGPENISDAQILDAVNILNRDYRKLNSDTAQLIAGFNSIAADVRIQFRLATIDPNGNCTNGIERIYSHLTNNADDNSKLHPWPHNKYLNIWTVRSLQSSGGFQPAAYAYFPSGNIYLIPYEGVITLSNYVGSIGTSAPFSSRTLTHEIGHYLNLQHPWGNNNSAATVCGDDGVSDTPVTKGHTSCSTTDLNVPSCTITSIASPFTFSKVTPISGDTDITAAPVSPSLGVTLGRFTAVGVGASSDSSRFSFAGWDTGGAADNADTTYTKLTGSINTSKYYEIKITPNNRYATTLTSISFTFQRSATGVRSYAVRSSVDGYANNLTASNGGDTLLRVPGGTNEFFSKYDTTSMLNGSTITLSGVPYTNTRSPITFRFYGWNAEDAAGRFSIDNVSFIGSIGAIENTQNYMDYSYCNLPGQSPLAGQSMFTQGQRDRMRAALRNYVDLRDNLSINSNLAATGATGAPAQTCIPYPDFYATGAPPPGRDAYNICAGGSITFTKNITNGTPVGNPVWTFPGGLPTTYTLPGNPTITYNTPGVYDVKLVASNSAGIDSVVKTALVRVSGSADLYDNGPYIEPFEDVTHFWWGWQVINLDNNAHTWEYSNVGYNSNHSVVMKGYNNYLHDIDEFISPTYDLSSVTNATLTYRCSGASTALLSTDLNDSVNIYSSTNCGQAWQLRSTIKQTALSNNGYHSESFVPNSASQWSLQTVTIPSAVATSNVRFKFVYATGNKSNNIYIDDINVSGIVGINENSLDNVNMSIYPNPTNQTSTVSYHLNKKSNVKISLVDVLGKKILDVSNNNQPEGDYSVLISKQEHNLNNGIYFIKFSVDDNTITKKLIITE